MQHKNTDTSKKSPNRDKPNLQKPVKGGNGSTKGKVKDDYEDDEENYFEEIDNDEGDPDEPEKESNELDSNQSEEDDQDYSEQSISDVEIDHKKQSKPGKFSEQNISVIF